MSRWTERDLRDYERRNKDSAPVRAANRKSVRSGDAQRALGDETDSPRFSCIDVQIHVTRRRGTDREATRIKAVIDGIVRGGIIKDDGDNEIKTIQVTKAKGSKEETIITVKQADPAIMAGVFYT